MQCMILQVMLELQVKLPAVDRPAATEPQPQAPHDSAGASADAPTAPDQPAAKALQSKPSQAAAALQEPNMAQASPAALHGSAAPSPGRAAPSKQSGASVPSAAQQQAPFNPKSGGSGDQQQQASQRFGSASACSPGNGTDMATRGQPQRASAEAAPQALPQPGLTPIHDPRPHLASAITANTTTEGPQQAASSAPRHSASSSRATSSAARSGSQRPVQGSSAATASPPGQQLLGAGSNTLYTNPIYTATKQPSTGRPSMALPALRPVRPLVPAASLQGGASSSLATNPPSLKLKARPSLQLTIPKLPSVQTPAKPRMDFGAFPAPQPRIAKKPKLTPAATALSAELRFKALQLPKPAGSLAAPFPARAASPAHLSADVGGSQSSSLAVKAAQVLSEHCPSLHGGAHDASTWRGCPAWARLHGPAH